MISDKHFYELTGTLSRLWGEGRGAALAVAPGRVNLIGEHTDYNDGFVLPIALDLAVKIAFRPSQDEHCRIWSCKYEEEDVFRLSELDKRKTGGWRDYVRAAAWALGCERLSPIEAVIDSNVPVGAGLSSSAAIEVGSALAFCSASGLEIERKKLAGLCQKAENEFVGVNCGIMDQFVCLHGRKNCAVLIDCMTLDYKLVQLDGAKAAIVVCNTMVHHELGDSAYNKRRASCEKGARIIGARLTGVRSLRDVKPEHLPECEKFLDPLTMKRVRHVVTEDARVLKSVELLARGELEEFGQAMCESHESLKKDYEVSCNELDLMVELAKNVGGCLGGRLTGAGFGGCTVNLVLNQAVEDFTKTVGREYRSETGIEPEFYVCSPSQGADIVR